MSSITSHFIVFESHSLNLELIGQQALELHTRPILHSLQPQHWGNRCMMSHLAFVWILVIRFRGSCLHWKLSTH